MLEPSIDSLQEKIPSKYTLVTIAAARARVLLEEGASHSLIENPKSNQFVGIALEEIQAGKLFVKKD